MAVLYYNFRTLYAGSAEPLSSTGPPRSVPERVGGRAGTAAPKGAVCELPNPPKLTPIILLPLRRQMGHLASQMAPFRAGQGLPPMPLSFRAARMLLRRELRISAAHPLASSSGNGLTQ